MRKDSRFQKVYHRYGFGTRLFMLMVVSLLFFPVSVSAQAQKKNLKMDKSQPIHIQSDRLDAYQEKKEVIFSGNAVATQGDRTIKSDRLLIYYKDSPGGTKKKDIQGMGAVGDIERLEAQGHVTITEPNRIVTGDHAVFYYDLQKIVMTGNAVMSEGKNIIRGGKIIVLLDEDRGIVEGSESKRVTATIYPDEKKEGNKK
jgi:lipopolysaccharide export system protein LptA